MLLVTRPSGRWDRRLVAASAIVSAYLLAGCGSGLKVDRATSDTGSHASARASSEVRNSRGSVPVSTASGVPGALGAAGLSGTEGPSRIAGSSLANGDLPALQVPAAGRYTYTDTSTENGGGAQSGTQQTEVSSSNKVSDGTAFTQGVSQPGQPTLNDKFLLTSTDEFQLTQSASVGSQNFQCTVEPPMLLFPVHLSLGKTWAVDSACQVTGIGYQAQVTIVGSSKVTGISTQVVGGRSFEVAVVYGTETITTNGSADGVQYYDQYQFAGTQWLAPSVGLPVRSTLSATERGSEGGRPYEARGTDNLVLQSAKPS